MAWHTHEDTQDDGPASDPAPPPTAASTSSPQPHAGITEVSSLLATGLWRRRRIERRRYRRPGCPELPWRAPPSLAPGGPGRSLVRVRVRVRVRVQAAV
eukprot:scaffold49674_cov46-Phaeocystis_antarctica.AAC.1